MWLSSQLKVSSGCTESTGLHSYLEIDSGSASKLFEVVGRINSLGVVGLSCCFASCEQGTAPSF